SLSLLLRAELSCLTSSLFDGYRAHRYLHSFPTRRSSDLIIIFRRPGAWSSAAILRCSRTRCYATIAFRRRSPWAWCSFVLGGPTDRKSTRLNSSHLGISYAVFCLKKKRMTEMLD